MAESGTCNGCHKDHGNNHWLTHRCKDCDARFCTACHVKEAACPNCAAGKARRKSI